jgi:hypothetical protein
MQMHVNFLVMYQHHVYKYKHTCSIALDSLTLHAMGNRLQVLFRASKWLLLFSSIHHTDKLAKYILILATHIDCSALLLCTVSQVAEVARSLSKALSTPSEAVQIAVADCLAPLCKVMRLLHKLQQCLCYYCCYYR